MMDRAERRVAVLDVSVDQDAHRADVVQRGRCPSPCGASCARCCRCASGRLPVIFAAHAGRREARARRMRDDVLDVARRRSRRLLVQQRRDRLVRFRLQRAQGSRGPRSSHLSCQTPSRLASGSEEVEHPHARRPPGGSLSMAAPPVIRKRSVSGSCSGELDQHDADVLDHRQQHLAAAAPPARRARRRRLAAAWRGSRPSGPHRPRAWRRSAPKAGRDVIRVERVRAGEALERSAARTVPASSFQRGDESSPFRRRDRSAARHRGRASRRNAREHRPSAASRTPRRSSSG